MDHRLPNSSIGEELLWDAGGTDSAGEPHCPTAPSFARTSQSWDRPGNRSWMAYYKNQAAGYWIPYAECPPRSPTVA
eukprot:4687812-Amphidinium_carterae.1